MGAKGLAHFPRARCLFLFGAQLHSTVQEGMGGCSMTLVFITVPFMLFFFLVSW